MDSERIDRRSVLKAFTVAAAAGVTGLAPRPAAAGPAGLREDLPDPSAADPTLALDDIQGNILAGFNKDHQALLFFVVRSADRARAWLGAMAEQVATSAEVLAFNRAYARVAGRGARPAPTSVWVNVALSWRGLGALGVPPAELGSFPAAFRQGMARRAALLGDAGPNAPERWLGPFGGDGVDGVAIVAADSEPALRRELGRQAAAMAARGIRVVFTQLGSVRSDQPGHEHFGFRDGISQPGIRGLTLRRNPDDPDQGDPGQDLLWPGEFVLGYGGEPGAGGGPGPGPVAASGPPWTADGAYLIFRRLRQDVKGFRDFVRQAAAAQDIHPDLMGAKLVGRYASGCPLERTADQDPGFDPTAADPSNADPTILDDLRINNFEFEDDDPDGALVPRAAHIRKAYPRDTPTAEGGEADTQTHRILRRGIPFGLSYDESAPPRSPAGADPAFPNDRGLLFLCYQSSIERQFEFVQRRWVNDPDFPESADGHDPVISQAEATKTFTLPGGHPDHLTMARFVVTTAGGYFLQPSVTALKLLSEQRRP